MSKDYYKILGVSKKSSKADIKKAYRNMAKQHHPDKGGDEKKFKEINEAYEVLGNDKKRTQYDQFGSAGPGFGGGGGGAGGSGFDFNNFSGGFSSASGGFGGFEDIFSSFFGGGSSNQRKSTKSRGADLEVEVDLSFEEAIKGVTKTFQSRNYEPCGKCDGKGGEGSKTCDQCGGKGAVSQRFQTPFGTIAQNTTCPKCQGEGQNFETVCKKCQGEGRVEEKHKIEVNIPSGVNTGETLRVTGKGEAGRQGGSRGDLFIHVRVKESDRFQRRGLDLIAPLKISVFEALLGGQFTVETFWGKVDLNIPENTKEGQQFRIRSKGVSRGGQQGDHIVRIEYQLPKKISSSLRDLLEKAKKEV